MNNPLEELYLSEEDKVDDDERTDEDDDSGEDKEVFDPTLELEEEREITNELIYQS